MEHNSFGYKQVASPLLCGPAIIPIGMDFENLFCQGQDLYAWTTFIPIMNALLSLKFTVNNYYEVIILVQMIELGMKK